MEAFVEWRIIANKKVHAKEETRLMHLKTKWKFNPKFLCEFRLSYSIVKWKLE